MKTLIEYVLAHGCDDDFISTLEWLIDLWEADHAEHTED